MVQIGVSYSYAYSKTFEDFISEGVQLGFNHFQLIPDMRPNLVEEFDDKRIEKLLDLRNRFNLSYSVHNVFYDINPVSLVPKVRNFALKITEDSLLFAKKIEGKSITIHPGYIFPPWLKKKDQNQLFWASAKESYSLLSNLSLKFGISIFIENGIYKLFNPGTGEIIPLHIGLTADELLKLLSFVKINSIGISLDIGKVLAQKKDPINYMKKLMPHIKEIQITNFENYTIILPKVITFLLKNNFNGTIIIETNKNRILKLKTLISNFLRETIDIN